MLLGLIQGTRSLSEINVMLKCANVYKVQFLPQTNDKTERLSVIGKLGEL